MRSRWVYFISSLALSVLLLGMFNVQLVSARSMQSDNQIHLTAAAAGRTHATVATHHVINMRQVPKEKPSSSTHRSQPAPFLTGVSPAVYAQRKQMAVHNPLAPKPSYVDPHPQKRIHPNTPQAPVSFQGESNNDGVAPPDQSVAASTQWVFQGVNISFAVYDTSGTLQSGWPKTAQSFFGIPNPTPSGCASGPYVTDPRAAYDVYDGRFWAVLLQDEGTFLDGTSCDFQATLWIGVSQTSDPNGNWNIYSFNLNQSPTTTFTGDYPSFAYDQQAIYFSTNMFNQHDGGYNYAKVYGVQKSVLESGASGFTAYGFFNLNVGGTSLDTIQPVLSLDPNGIGTGLLVNSFNINFGSGQCSKSCSGIVTWALANPGQPNDSITGVVVQTSSYSLAPAADEPGCTTCMETLDTRISGTPSYRGGLISFALETAATNSQQTVPGIFWGQIAPTVSSGVLTGASLFQSGYYLYGTDQAASFPALMTDNDGNLFMVLEYMSSGDNPSVVYSSRRVSDPAGTFPDGGIFLRQGDAAYSPCSSTNVCRWGDYEATSFDGFASNHVWFAGEYSTSTGDWSTYIGEDNY
jgi:hypothetical protein